MKQSNGDDNPLIIFVCHLHPTLYFTFTQQTPYHNIIQWGVLKYTAVCRQSTT